LEIESIPKLIIDILSKESRLTINEIFEKLELPKERKEYLRLCVNRLSADKRKDKDGNIVKVNPKIAKDGKREKEYLYSLKNDVIDFKTITKGFKEYNELFMDISKEKELSIAKLKSIAKKKLDFDILKKAEMESKKDVVLG